MLPRFYGSSSNFHKVNLLCLDGPVLCSFKELSSHMHSLIERPYPLIECGSQQALFYLTSEFHLFLLSLSKMSGNYGQTLKCFPQYFNSIGLICYQPLINELFLVLDYSSNSLSESLPSLEGITNNLIILLLLILRILLLFLYSVL